MKQPYCTFIIAADKVFKDSKKIYIDTYSVCRKYENCNFWQDKTEEGLLHDTPGSKKKQQLLGTYWPLCQQSVICFPVTTDDVKCVL